MNKNLYTKVWLPHYYFFLYSVAHCYPTHPNEVTKRKYYDFIQNLPLLIPHSEYQKKMVSILYSFPVTPYLSNKDSFTFWVHFINNKLESEQGNKEKTYMEHLDDYYNEYLPKEYILSKKLGIQKKYIIFFILTLCFIFILQNTK